MPDINLLGFDADDSKLIASLEKQLKLVESISTSAEDLEKAYEDSFKASAKEAGNLVTELDKVERNTDKVTTSTDNLDKSVDGFGKNLKGAIGDMKIFGVSLNDVDNKLKAIKGNSASAGTGIGSLAKRFGVLKIAIASTGIGLLLVALGAMFTAVQRNQTHLDKFNQVLASIGGVVDELINRFASFGESLFSLFRGDLAGAASNFKDSVSGIGSALGEAARNASDLKKSQQDIAREVRALNTEYSQAEAAIKGYNKIAEDVTKTEKERLAAAKSAIQLEQTFQQDRIEIAQRELGLIERTNEQNSIRSEDSEEFAEKQREIAQISAGSLELQTTLTNKLNQIQLEGQAKRKAALAEELKLTAEYQKQLEVIDKQVEQTQLKQLSPEERVKAETEIAKAAIDGQLRLVEETAKAAGRTIDLTAEKILIVEQLEAESQRKIDKIRSDGLTNLETISGKAALTTPPLVISPEGVTVDPEAENKINDSLRDTFDRIFTKIGGAFGLEGGEFDKLFSGFVDFVNNLDINFSGNIDRLLEENDRLITGLSDQRKDLQDQIERELDRQSDGYSSNVQAKQEQLEEINKLEAEAFKEQEALQKRQRRAQLFADIASQSSALATSSANIIKDGTVKGGLLGVLLALPVIGAMFTIFNNAKKRAAESAATDVKLFKGGSIKDSGAFGFVNQKGRSDKYGKGHKVQDSNLVLGGREFVSSEEISERNAEFLFRMNTGAYTGHDLVDLVDTAIENKKTVRRSEKLSARIIRAKESHQDELVTSAIHAATEKQTAELISYWKGRPAPVMPITKDTIGHAVLKEDGSFETTRREI